MFINGGDFLQLVNLVFSPTGGTKKVSQIVEESFSTDGIFVDLTEPIFNESDVQIDPDDICLIAVPAFGGRVPKIAEKRISLLNGNNAKVILIVTFGNRDFEDSLIELQDIAISANFKPIAAIAAVTQHSIMPQFGTGRPNMADKIEIKKFTETIVDYIYKVKFADQLQLPGNEPYKDHHKIKIHPKGNNKCNECKECALACPVEAIDKNNPRVTDINKCISCMKCVSICKNNSRKVNKMMTYIAANKMAAEFEEVKKNQLFL